MSERSTASTSSTHQPPLRSHFHLSSAEGAALHISSVPSTITMFRTALRSSARAAGAISASSRFAAVRTPSRATRRAPMPHETTSDGLNGSENALLHHADAVLELHSSCTGRPGTPEALRDSALTCHILLAATNNPSRRHCFRSRICRRIKGTAHRGVLHPGTENPWRARGVWSRRDRPSPYCWVCGQ